MSTRLSVEELLKNTSNGDKDERYMATNDLCFMLNNDLRCDEKTEQRICAAVLKQLDDGSSDVQSVAVKCLAVLVKKVAQTQIEEITTKLANLVLTGDANLRDIYSIGLKTLLADVSDSMGPTVADHLTPRLLEGITMVNATNPAAAGNSSQNNPTDAISRECLDLLVDLLRRFGHLVTSKHAEIMVALVSKLSSNSTPIRKRAIQSLGALAVVSSDKLLTDLMKVLLDRITKAQHASGDSSNIEIATLIQTVGTISRMVGYRLSPFIGQILPLFIEFCGSPTDENNMTTAANELRESCLPGVESFILRCPTEMISYLPEIVRLATGFARYDPNYDDADENGDEMLMDEDEDDQYSTVGSEDFDVDDLGQYSEDDDDSWKVRKASIRVISALFTTSHLPITTELWIECLTQLVGRFKDREENVRMDVISCLDALIMSATRSMSSNSKEVMGVIQSRLDQIVSASLVQLRGESMKTKTAVMSLLSTIVKIMPEGFERFLERLLRRIDSLVNEKNQHLRLDCLQFLHSCLVNLRPAAIQPLVSILEPLLVRLVSDSWYKASAHAIRNLEELIKAMRPRINGILSPVVDGTYVHVMAISAALVPRLQATDLDVEIKEAVVSAVGILINRFADLLADQVPSILKLIENRLSQETSRFSTLNSIWTISQTTDLPLDLSSLPENCATEFSAFLKQYSRNLRTLTLQTLNALIRHPSATVSGTFSARISEDILVCLSDRDVHMTGLALRVLTAIVQKNSSAGVAMINEPALSKLVNLTRSPLLQGDALSGLVSLFKALTQTNEDRFQYPALSHELLRGIGLTSDNPEPGHTKFSGVSKCLAGVISLLPSDTLFSTISDLLSEKPSLNLQQLALLTVGEVASQVDLSAVPNLANRLLTYFNSTDEEIKLAASFALGHAAVGSPVTFLPALVTAASTSVDSRHQYLVLAGLKEAITIFTVADSQQKSNFESHLPTILPLLCDLRTSSEDSIRSVVAECFGLLLTVYTPAVLAILSKMLGEAQASRKESNESDMGKNVVVLVIHAFRTALSHPMDQVTTELMVSALRDLWPLLHDEDFDVKKAMLTIVNLTSHHNPVVLVDVIVPTITPVLISTLQLRAERNVDLGPFKHKIDDALPLRRLALSIVETFLLTTPDRLDARQFLSVAPTLLADNDEVKTLFLQIVPRLCEAHGRIVANHVADMVDALDTVTKNLLSKQDKSTDLLKTVVRAVIAIDRVEETRQVCRRWSEFHDSLLKSPFVSSLHQQLVSEKIEGF